MRDTRTRPKGRQTRSCKKTEVVRNPVDSDIRELTALMYAAMGRFEVIRRTFAASLGLNAAEFAVVISLHRSRNGEGARIKELADNIHTAAANVTATVKALERKKWVVKSADPIDSRALAVKLTSASRRRLDEFFETIHPVNEIWFSNISKAERYTVKHFLLVLIDQYPSALVKARILLSRRVRLAGNLTD